MSTSMTMEDRIRGSTTGLQLRSASCSDGGGPPVGDQSRPHPSGCTLFFPFRGLVIGANHTVHWIHGRFSRTLDKWKLLVPLGNHFRMTRRLSCKPASTTISTSTTVRETTSKSQLSHTDRRAVRTLIRAGRIRPIAPYSPISGSSHWG